MNKNISIKTKLLLSTLFIQAFTLVLFSYGLYKALEFSTFDKVQSNLRIITLKVVDDLLSNKKILNNIKLDEDEKFKFKPLYIRIIEPKSQKIVVSTRFPKEINTSKERMLELNEKNIEVSEISGYIVSRTKVKAKKNLTLIVEVATSKSTINATLDNLLYILLIIIPIIFIIATISTVFLLNKSFSPMKTILDDLKIIKATKLSERLSTIHSDYEIKELTKEINNLLNRLETSFEKVKEFSSDASHELKTPLTIIRGEIEVALKQDRDVNEYKKTLKISLDEIIVIQKTINDLLFLSKIEQQSNEKEEIYLDEISIDAIEEVKSYAKSKSINIDYNIDDIIHIYGFSHTLKIAIKNILKNAISYSEINSNIFLRNYSEEDYHVISIKDTGVGIAKNEQNKIFENFYRADKSRNKYSGGTGLGMSIAKKIIDIHDGKIEIKSEENIGTTIFFKFPKTIQTINMTKY